MPWDLVMAALEACPADDVSLWCMGDGPCDVLAAEPGMIDRFYAEREARPKLRRLFEVMRGTSPSEGEIPAWWFQ